MSDFNTRMTWEEIRKRYSNQWVVLIEQELQADDSSQLHTARVLTCGSSRAEAVRRAYPAVTAYASYDCRYTGGTRPRRAEYRPLSIEVINGYLPSGDETLIVESAQASMDAMITDGHLTWDQICERYPEQWVVLIDHERLPDTLAGFKTARVLAVGSSRAEAKDHARPQLDSISSWGCHFTGPIRGPQFGYRPWFIP